MIKVTVLYPNNIDVQFDWDYYLHKHLSLVREKFGPYGLIGLEADKGIASGINDPPLFVAACHMTFDTVEKFQNAFVGAGSNLINDIPNYTNIEPKIQISEVIA